MIDKPRICAAGSKTRFAIPQEHRGTLRGVVQAAKGGGTGIFSRHLLPFDETSIAFVQTSPVLELLMVLIMVLWKDVAVDDDANDVPEECCRFIIDNG